MHLWRYVGWLMGVDDDWLFTTEREQNHFLHHVLLVQDDVTPAGPALAGALVDGQRTLAGGLRGELRRRQCWGCCAGSSAARPSATWSCPTARSGRCRGPCRPWCSATRPVRPRGPDPGRAAGPRTARGRLDAPRDRPPLRRCPAGRGVTAGGIALRGGGRAPRAPSRACAARPAGSRRGRRRGRAGPRPRRAGREHPDRADHRRRRPGVLARRGGGRPGRPAARRRRVAGRALGHRARRAAPAPRALAGPARAGAHALPAASGVRARVAGVARRGTAVLPALRRRGGAARRRPARPRPRARVGDLPDGARPARLPDGRGAALARDARPGPARRAQHGRGRGAGRGAGPAVHPRRRGRHVAGGDPRAAERLRGRGRRPPGGVPRAGGR